ncbi:MAG: ECF transporter S component [Candidatus Xenobiia bacterium LiM19]
MAISAGSSSRSRQIGTHQITIGGLFLALSIVLATTGWGLIAIPTPAGAVTTMHLPVICAGVVGGPILGTCSGLVFGLFAWQRFPAFDPLVHILPRVLIGFISWGAFSLISYILKSAPRRLRLSTAAISAAAAGTIVNTAGVLAMAVLHGYFTPSAAWTIALVHGIPELILAVIVTPPIISGLVGYIEHRGSERGFAMQISTAEQV